MLLGTSATSCSLTQMIANITNMHRTSFVAVCGWGPQLQLNLNVSEDDSTIVVQDIWIMFAEEWEWIFTRHTTSVYVVAEQVKI